MTLANGTHTISSVSSTPGNAECIDSRFFSVQNETSALTSTGTIDSSAVVSASNVEALGQTSEAVAEVPTTRSSRSERSNQMTNRGSSCSRMERRDSHLHARSISTGRRRPAQCNGRVPHAAAGRPPLPRRRAADSDQSGQYPARLGGNQCGGRGAICRTGSGLATRVRHQRL